MSKKVRKAAALITVLIIIIIISILSIGMIYTHTSNARLLESQIRRTRATYAAKAVMWQVIDVLSRGISASAESLYCAPDTNCNNLQPPGPVGEFAASDFRVQIWKEGIAGAPDETRRISVRINYTP